MAIVFTFLPNTDYRRHEQEVTLFEKVSLLYLHLSPKFSLALQSVCRNNGTRIKRIEGIGTDLLDLFLSAKSVQSVRHCRRKMQLPTIFHHGNSKTF